MESTSSFLMRAFSGKSNSYRLQRNELKDCCPILKISEIIDLSGGAVCLAGYLSAAGFSTRQTGFLAGSFSV